MISTDIFIIGAGIAGITAAKEAAKAGKSVFLADREEGFGGVLRRCSHRGFGKGLTGNEYIQELTGDFPESVVKSFSTSVLELREDKTALLSNRRQGLFRLSFSHVILAAGAMEISPGMLPLGGTRPRGIYTAGEAQLMNFCGLRFPSPIVILGSGDLGLIMAQQLYDQEHDIACIIEKKSGATALARNRGILDHVPLITQNSISDIHGEHRLEAVTLENPIQGKSPVIPCKTLLIAAGLKPDKKLADGFENAPWLSFCGNCMKIYPTAEMLAAETRDTVKAVCERI